MITISEKARAILQNLGAGDGAYIRVQVKTGGCAGMTYEAEIDTEKKENERIVMADADLILISDDASIAYLDGLHIDYSDDLISAGFRFSNSRNDNSCGCGSSFQLAGFPKPGRGGTGCGR